MLLSDSIFVVSDEITKIQLFFLEISHKKIEKKKKHKEIVLLYHDFSNKIHKKKKKND